MKKVREVSVEHYIEEYTEDKRKKLKFDINKNEIEITVVGEFCTAFITIPIEKFRTMIRNSQEVLDYYELRKKLQ